MKTPRFWQTRNLLSTALLPASALYAAGFALDRRFTTKQRAPLPVISVGNITAGGAGKTPTAIALAALLQGMGEVPHIVTRGYGGSIRTVHRVTDQDRADTVGDEALLLARHAPTWVAPRRHDAAMAAKEAGATLVIADDALQHHALAHDLSVLVVDLQTGFGNGRLLPAGPLRQTLASAYHAPTIAVAIGADDPRQLLPQLQVQGEVFRATLAPTADTGWLQQGRWLAFAGIAYPQKFYATLRELGAEVAQTVDFPDHHPFSSADIPRLRAQAQDQGLQLITTEKDEVRLPDAAGIRSLPVALQWQDGNGLQAALAAWRSGA